MKESRRCPFCGKETTVEVDKEGYSAYLAGVDIVEAFPDMSSFDREVLITGMCYDCQSSTFNRPKPGEDWGKCLGECTCCGCSVWESKNKLENGLYFCRSCGTRMSLDGDSLVDVEEGEYDEPV